MPNTLQQNGAITLPYVFGFFTSTDAPTITGFASRSAELTFEPEVYTPAMDGEGHTTALARAGLKISASYGGYLTSDNLNTLDETFSGAGLVSGKFFIVKGVSDPRRKGDFVEATLEAEHYANITST